MDCICIQGLEFYGRHGCLPEENALGQLFAVDVSLYLDLAPVGKSDNLHDTVNYALVAKTVEKVVEGKPQKLIESVAEKIAQNILDEYEPVKRLKITVHKSAAPLEVVFRDVSVTIERERS